MVLSFPNSPPTPLRLRAPDSFQLVSEAGLTSFTKKANSIGNLCIPAHWIGQASPPSELALLGEGMDSLGPPPRLDGTGFQWWKILMQSHLQAKGLNVWRVTSEGTKSNSQQEKQYNVIAKCAILNSLGKNVFNRVFACENANVL